jgi:hypothetical protein
VSRSRPGPASEMADAMADATSSEMAGSSAAFPDPAVVRYSAIRRPVVGWGAIGCRQPSA